MADPHRRGVVFEGVLNEIFALDGLLVRESFTITREKEVVEQIDGLIELDGQLYLVEAKWWSTKLGPDVTAQHLVRLFSRAGAHGGADTECSQDRSRQGMRIDSQARGSVWQSAVAPLNVGRRPPHAADIVFE